MQPTLFNKVVAKEIARELLQIGAIKLSPDAPFSWASGWKSPIYCDNRLSLSFPTLRMMIKDAFCDAIKQHYGSVEAIAGVATAGIPQGALIADKLNLPFLYVRSKSKGHGLENRIEGKLKKDQNIVVVEDLVSTGGSSIQAIEAIRQAQGRVLGMVSIFTYGFAISNKNLQDNNTPLVYLSDYSTLVELAQEEGTIDHQTGQLLNAWREDPENWGQQ